MRVFVYRNLHKKCYSIRSIETGLVIAHADKVLLRDCEFRVSEAGRQRVLRERKKNVHAGVVGTLVRCKYVRGGHSKNQVCYNPYKTDKFRICVPTAFHGAPVIETADEVRLTPNGIFAEW